jgi:type II secretory pathway pseudopilin PulG
VAKVLLNGIRSKSGLRMKLKYLLRVQSRRQWGMAGFSLFEATMAMAVVGICSLALFSGLTSGFFNIQLARENLRATQIMLEKTETLRLYNWDQINTAGFVPTNFAAQYDPNAPDGSQGLTYNGTLTIGPAPLSTSYSNDVRLVVVTVTWRTGGINRNREFNTYVARNGLQTYIY